MQFGINLYSLRDFIQTEDDFVQTAEKVKKMGYSFLQYSGADFDPDRILRVSQKTGMPIVLTHNSLDKILNETDALIDGHLKFGCTNIGLGFVPPATFADEAKSLELVKNLNAVGEKMAKRGCKFFYHHHQAEFIQLPDGTPFLEYLFEHAPFVNFILDTYWLQCGGVDICDFVKRYAGRIDCVHLKDYRVLFDEKKQPPYFSAYAPVNEGTLDFKKIIAAMKEAGVKYFLVEQDDAVDYANPFGEVEKSIKYLKENF